MILIPSGFFLMGEEDGQADERPVRRVFVPAFEIDRTEVTRADYRKCVEAGACKAIKEALFTSKADDRLPMTQVSIMDSRQYCRFLGKRLPNEAEWEKAARGPDKRRYPWGNSSDCRKANFGNYDGQGPCASVNPGRPEPVGARPAGRSPYGVDDMAGNVWEWVESRPDLLPSAPRKGLAVARGGSASSVFLLPRAANRLLLPEGYRDDDIGFRCAKVRALHPDGMLVHPKGSERRPLTNPKEAPHDPR